MTTSELQQPAQTRVRYASILRCIGQFLETMDLKAVEVKTHGDDYIVQAWNKGTSMTMDLEKHWTLDDLRQLDAGARERRKAVAGLPNLLGLSQVLRLTGNYVDRMGGRLMRVSWQDQSYKIQSITVQWEPHQPRRETNESQATTVEELCVHIYKQRKKISLASEKQGHRPFVSVGRVT